MNPEKLQQILPLFAKAKIQPETDTMKVSVTQTVNFSQEMYTVVTLAADLTRRDWQSARPELEQGLRKQVGPGTLVLLNVVVDGTPQELVFTSEGFKKVSAVPVRVTKTAPQNGARPTTSDLTPQIPLIVKGTDSTKVSSTPTSVEEESTTDQSTIEDELVSELGLSKLELEYSGLKYTSVWFNGQFYRHYYKYAQNLYRSVRVLLAVKNGEYCEEKESPVAVEFYTMEYKDEHKVNLIRECYAACQQVHLDVRNQMNLKKGEKVLWMTPHALFPFFYCRLKGGGSERVQCFTSLLLQKRETIAEAFSQTEEWGWQRNPMLRSFIAILWATHPHMEGIPLSPDLLKEARTKIGSWDFPKKSRKR